MTSAISAPLRVDGHWRILLRRLVFVVLVVLTSGAASFQSLRLLMVNGLNPVDIRMLGSSSRRLFL